MQTSISYFQALILGLVQGVAEPFPISSLGHSVIIPGLAGWSFQSADNDRFLTFLIATHLATAIMLLLFFLKDWIRIAKGFWRSLVAREIPAGDADARLAWVVIVGTVPVGVIGLALQKPLEKLFASPAAAAFLVINGIALLGFERLRSRQPEPDDFEGDADLRIAGLSWRNAIAVGASQAFALIPGISRSGMTMGGGLLVGLSNEDAARYGFLLATPVIGAAALLKLPHLMGSAGNGLRGPALLGGLCAALTTYLAVKFLLKFFETNRLTGFGFYCIGAGLLFTLIFAL